MLLNSFKYLRSYSKTASIYKINWKFRGVNTKYSFSTEQKSDDPEVIEFFEQELQTIKDVNSFLRVTNILASIATTDKVQLKTKRAFFHKLIDHFPQMSNKEEDIRQFPKISDSIVGLYQIKIEYIDPEMVISTSKLISKHHTKYFKSYWHFIEFLLTRTNFLNTFTESHAVQLLNAYYEIENNLEADKYQYIFDKMEEFFSLKPALSLTEDELTRVLNYYTKSNLGGQLLYSKFYERFQDLRKTMKLENFISCAWGFVNYSLRAKDKSMKVYDQESYNKISNGIQDLNSYYIKQFLWSYHKEKELLS